MTTFRFPQFRTPISRSTGAQNSSSVPTPSRRTPSGKLKTVTSVLMVGMLVGSAVPVTAQEPIPKFLLIELTRDQFSSMCGTPEFTQCMGFDEQQCLEISNKAIDTCLGPLPAAIDPTALENDALEACPQNVFNEAGFAEEKAKQCFEEVIK